MQYYSSNTNAATYSIKYVSTWGGGLSGLSVFHAIGARAQVDPTGQATMMSLLLWVAWQKSQFHVPNCPTNWV